MIPITRNVSTYAAYDGHWCASPYPRPCSDVSGTWMSSTSSVIAIAITASLNASTRADSLISVVVLANPLTVSGTDRYNSVMTLTENPFLSGNYGPVAEEVTAFDLPTDGALPTELDGRYLRIGPNPYAPPEGAYHWFLGDGMVHGVEIARGRATWYRNRWVRTSGI